MARTDLTRTDITRAGVGAAGVAGTVDGHMFTNSGDEFLEVANAAGAARVVTIVTPRTVEGLAVAERTATIPASTTRKIGPFDPQVYNQPSGADRGKVYVNYEAGQEAQFTTALYRLPEA